MQLPDKEEVRRLQATAEYEKFLSEIAAILKAGVNLKVEKTEKPNP